MNPATSAITEILERIDNFSILSIHDACGRIQGALPPNHEKRLRHPSGVFAEVTDAYRIEGEFGRKVDETFGALIEGASVARMSPQDG